MHPKLPRLMVDRRRQRRRKLNPCNRTHRSLEKRPHNQQTHSQQGESVPIAATTGEHASDSAQPTRSEQRESKAQVASEPPAELHDAETTGIEPESFCERDGQKARLSFTRSCSF